MTDIETRVAAQFAGNTAEHKLTILHDDGLYRHILMSKPGTGLYRYELVTWPGHLAISGDLDSYVFSRVEDMFTFFRSKEVNPAYWAEKVQDGRERTKRYSEDLLRSALKEDLAEFEKAYPDLLARHNTQKAKYAAAPHAERYPFVRNGIRDPGSLWSPLEAREAVADAEAGGSTMYEDGARELLSELESNGVTGYGQDTNLSDWDWHFLYCLNAIVAGIAAYDAAKVSVGESVNTR